jgi:hypothetical protein
MVAAIATTAWWLRVAQEGDLAAAILAYVRENDGTTFAALQEAFDPYIEVWGVMDLGPREESLVYWQGMSPAFVDVLAALFAAGLLYGRPASPRLYCASGQAPGLPLARRLPKGGYKALHWLPITLHAAA